jgi:hypothetical protein
MHVWTTREFNSLLSITELPIRLFPRDELKIAFLAQYSPRDIAIIPFDDEYLEFLSAVKKQGISSLILLISPEPTIIETDLQGFNALVLDIKTMGEGTVKQIVHVILELAAHQEGVAGPGVIFDNRTPGTKREKPVEDLSVILGQLADVCKKDVPVMIAMEMHEAGHLVTVRSLCTIKDVRNDAIVFHKFKQSLFLKEMKVGQSVMLHYPFKQNSHSFIVMVRHSRENELLTSVPTQLFPTRGFRIQPNQSKPVRLYVHIANEPSINFKVLDISIRGIGFVCTRDLSVDTKHGFTIVLPDPPVIVVTVGIVRFKKESSQGIRYGAEFRPHPWDEENIAKYIMKREGEIMALLRAK